MSNFTQRARNFGINRIIKSYDFIISLVISLVGYFTFFEALTPPGVKEKFLSDVIISSITITTIVLAGFAIVIALTEKELIKYLQKYNIYDNMIFTFEYTALVSLSTFVVSLISKYLVNNHFFYFFNIFLIIYLISILIQLILFIHSFGAKKGQLYK